MSITSTVVSGAEIQFIDAAAALRPYVGCFWVLTAGRNATLRIVPDGSTSISIELQNRRPSEWFLRGPLLRAEERRFTSPASLVGIRLRPGVAFILSGIAAHTLVGGLVRLSEVPAFRALVSDRPLECGPAGYVDVLQRFLIERLKNAAVHPVVASAIHEIEAHDGCPPVGEIAARCGVSARHLNRLMRVWVGYGPKRFARIARFQATLAQIDDSPGRSAAALAAENGYFDQAHLTLDVNRLAGATPGHLVSNCVADFSKTRCS